MLMEEGEEEEGGEEWWGPSQVSLKKSGDELLLSIWIAAAFLPTSLCSDLLIHPFVLTEFTHKLYKWRISKVGECNETRSKYCIELVDTVSLTGS